MKVTDMMPEATDSQVVQLYVRTFIEEDRHVARCDALEISDNGDSEDEALDNLANTIGLFFISCTKRGTIAQLLREKGIGTAEDAKYYFPVVRHNKPHASHPGH